jgi:phage portal protein BeeE
MNLLQSLRRRSFTLPDEIDPYAMLGRTALPVNGAYETTSHDLVTVAENVYKKSGPIFALIAVRQALFSEARFQWQQMRNGRPGDLFGDQSLSILERPWRGGTTGDLLARAELDVSIMGNAFITDRTIDRQSGMLARGDRLRRLRPDWVTIVWGSESEPELAGDALDGELLGYLYTPRMPGSMGWGETQILGPEDVAHYAPYPDPSFQQRGMSWLTPVLREISADHSALEHKLAFFRNGAVPRLAMRVDPSVKKPAFEKLVAAMESEHAGAWNHYKTLYVGGGADPVPLTFNLRDLDFKAIQGGGESRLAAAAGVPPTVVGFSEGLSGSSLNAGNFGQARRLLADKTMRHLWRNMCGALETLVPPPSNSRLWYDDRDIAFLREDRIDAATIASTQATMVRTLTDAGFEPDAAIAAATSGDLGALKGKHSGLFSVQLQPPGNNDETANDPTTPAQPDKPQKDGEPS